MIVIIAEKPSLARSVAKVIGIVNEHKADGYIECRNDYAVTWVFGHILELAEPQAYDDKYQRWNLADLPIRPNEWQLLVKKDAKDQYKNIQALLKQADSVVNCGDPDREGQLLVDEVLLHLQCTKPTKRLLILDPKDAAIRRALDNMEDNSKYYSWYQAGLLRSQADWLIGMNFTRAFTNLSRSHGGEGVTSVGRVQTPTLKLIYDRDLAISNFKPLNYYNLHGIFSNHAAQQFMAKLDYTSLGFLLDEQGRLLDDKVLQDICSEIKQQPGIITK
jgi:DNA topoisomerase-3